MNVCIVHNYIQIFYIYFFPKTSGVGADMFLALYAVSIYSLVTPNLLHSFVFYVDAEIRCTS